jgi:phospholipid transport system substrate-binding protein
MSLRRRLFLGFAAVAATTAIGFPPRATASVPSAPIEQLHAALLGIMRAGKSTPFRQRYDTLAPVIDRTFDLAGILRNAVGVRWAATPADQQAALTEAFRRYTIATYVDSFDNFAGQRFELLSAAAAGGDQIVRTRIVPASGEAHRIDYVMRDAGGAWKVVDILADGSISRVTAQRSEIRSLLTSGGAPALLDRMQKKTLQLSGGQVQ